jgi:hypothetical protein
MVVLTARAVAERLVRIKKLSSLYREEVEIMRADTVKTTVNALWRRYREFKKRSETDPSFVEWLVSCEHFEDTFWKSNGVATRRRWSIQYLNFLVRKELTFADDPESLWLFDAVEVAINARHRDPDWIIVIETEDREAIPRYRLKEGAAIRFEKRERPAPEEEGDSTS